MNRTAKTIVSLTLIIGFVFILYLSIYVSYNHFVEQESVGYFDNSLPQQQREQKKKDTENDQNYSGDSQKSSKPPPPPITPETPSTPDPKFPLDETDTSLEVKQQNPHISQFTVPSHKVIKEGSPLYARYKDQQSAQCQGSMNVKMHLQNGFCKNHVLPDDFNGWDHSISEFWPKFTPSRQEYLDAKETPLGDIMKTELWERFMKTIPGEINPETNSPYTEEMLDDIKVQINLQFPTLNKDKFEPVPDKHVPLCLLVYKRTQPLDSVLSYMTKARDINQTRIILSIDGNYRDNEQVIKMIIQMTDFTRANIFFHPYTRDVEQLKFPKNAGCSRINSNLNFLSRVSYETFNYPFVAFLSDDYIPFPDFYTFQRDTYLHALYRNTSIMGVQSYPTGPVNDCNYILSRLTNTGDCNQHTLDHIVLENWYGGYITGINRKLFVEYLKIGEFVECFDSIMVCLMLQRQYKLISPCRNLGRYIPNVGEHGAGQPRWENPIPIDEPETYNISTYYTVNNNYKPLPSSSQIWNKIKKN